jgi:hypothetical protein
MLATVALAGEFEITPSRASSFSRAKISTAKGNGAKAARPPAAARRGTPSASLGSKKTTLGPALACLSQMKLVRA